MSKVREQDIQEEKTSWNIIMPKNELAQKEA
jgi:hypothetical protein